MNLHNMLCSCGNKEPLDNIRIDHYGYELYRATCLVCGKVTKEYSRNDLNELKKEFENPSSIAETLEFENKLSKELKKIKYVSQEEFDKEFQGKSRNFRDCDNYMFNKLLKKIHLEARDMVLEKLDETVEVITMLTGEELPPHTPEIINCDDFIEIFGEPITQEDKDNLWELQQLSEQYNGLLYVTKIEDRDDL